LFGKCPQGARGEKKGRVGYGPREGDGQMGLRTEVLSEHLVLPREAAVNYLAATR